MKTTFNPWHLFKQNTPKIVHAIGNIALILASGGATILAIPTALSTVGIEGIVLPVFAAHIAKICLATGTIIKLFSKMFGTIKQGVQPDNQEVPK